MGKQIQEYERYLIERYRNIEKCSVSEIARRLHRNHSVILYELKKGTVTQLDGLLKEHQVYYADVAQRVTLERGHNKGAKTKLSKDSNLSTRLQMLNGDSTMRGG